MKLEKKIPWNATSLSPRNSIPCTPLCDCLLHWTFLSLNNNTSVFLPEFIVVSRNFKYSRAHTILVYTSFLRYNDIAKIVGINLFINLVIEVKMTSNRFTKDFTSFIASFIMRTLLRCKLPLYCVQRDSGLLCHT